MYLYHENDSPLTKIYGRLRAMAEEPEFLNVSVSQDGYVYSTTHEACDKTESATGFRNCGIRQEESEAFFKAKQIPDTHIS